MDYDFEELFRKASSWLPSIQSWRFLSHANGCAASAKTLVLFALGLPLCARESQSQATGATLPRASARLAVSFGSVLSVRTLGDTALLVADRQEGLVFHGAWRTGSTKQVGRRGEGPGEYGAPGMLLGLAGDTTILTDLSSGKWIILQGTSFVRQMTRAERVPQHLGALPGGASEAGLVASAVGLVSPSRRERRMFPTFPEFADTLLVLAGSLRRERIDTLAKILGGYRGAPNEVTRSVQGAPITYILRSALSTHEQAVLTPDGSIALLRMDPFRVEWLSGSGRIERSQLLPYPDVVVDDKEKEAVLSMLRSEGALSWRAEDYPHWPRVLPPFLARAGIPAGRSRVAIRLMPSRRDTRTRYLIVERTSPGYRELILPAGERIVAFTPSGAVVVARRDDDGLEWLSLHRP